jgi:hypothetical protein
MSFCSFVLLLLAFGADAFRTPAGSRGLGAGGLEGVGHAVVLAGLPDDRIPVVLVAVVDCDADPEGEGGLALGDIAVADPVRAVDGHPEVGVEPVEGLLGGPPGLPLVVVDPVVRVELEGLGGQIVLG